MKADPLVEVLTFGCRLNIVESETMRRHALAAGHRDLTIVNSCAVTAEAARQSRQAVRRARKNHPERRLIVTGCASELDPEGFRSHPGVASVLPNAIKAQARAWPRVGDVGSVPRSPADVSPSITESHSRGFVEVQNGCDHRCTFCVIPFGRGASRSIPGVEVIERINALVQSGVRDVVLTGVDITSYGGDLDGRPSLGALIAAILKAVPDLPRLRLSSLDCVEADPLLLEAIATERRLMPHLHLSLQAGSDLVLKRMKRRHTRQEAIDFCKGLRRLRPDIALSADLIAGFPTETDAMFGDTMDLVKACGLDQIHVFPFSARPGTPAARMPAVPGEVIKDRARQLRILAERRLRQHLDRQVGRHLVVLTERGGKARTEDFTLVRLHGNPEPGRFLPVTFEGHDGRALLQASPTQEITTA